MIKKVFLLNLLSLVTYCLQAQNLDTKIVDESNLALLLTLIVAVIALIIAVINSFRISHHNKIVEVELVNLKDDINVTIEAVKIRLFKDVRNLRKELTKGPRPQRPHEKPQNNDLSAEVSDNEDEKPTERKPFKRRNQNYKRRPSNKNKTEQNNENSSEQN